jgi:hypothetical protein
MAAVTVASTDSAQGIIRVFNFTAVATGSTFTCLEPVKAYWLVNTSSADAVTATFVASTGVFTITVANSPSITLFVLS